jgi:hypothetical protein
LVRLKSGRSVPIPSEPDRRANLVPTKRGTRNGTMSLFNEKLLREIVAEEVRRVLREE